MTSPRKRRAILRPIAPVTGRDAVWQAIRAMAPAEFTVRDIGARVASGLDLPRDYLRGLVKAGIVALVGNPPLKPSRYRLIRDVGVEAPRVRPDGTLDDAPSDQERMWQAMKVLRAFRAADIQASTQIAALISIRGYIAHLHRAGYLAIVEPGIRGRREASYRLLPTQNTGPRPPTIKRGRIVVDQNTGRQMWPEVPA